MKNDNKRIIKEFLEGTPHWIEELKKMKELGGFELCPYCGVNPIKIESLAEAVKELQEKAWMYDDLCK